MDWVHMNINQNEAGWRFKLAETIESSPSERLERIPGVSPDCISEVRRIAKAAVGTKVMEHIEGWPKLPWDRCIRVSGVDHNYLEIVRSGWAGCHCIAGKLQQLPSTQPEKTLEWCAQLRRRLEVVDTPGKLAWKLMSEILSVQYYYFIPHQSNYLFNRIKVNEIWQFLPIAQSGAALKSFKHQAWRPFQLD